MPVYVDHIFTVMPRNPQARKYGDQWCHLFGDTEEEIHAIAKRIGLSPKYFQNDNPRFPHYDLTATLRKKAIQAGAKELALREWIKMMRQESFVWIVESVSAITDDIRKPVALFESEAMLWDFINLVYPDRRYPYAHHIDHFYSDGSYIFITKYKLIKSPATQE